MYEKEKEERKFEDSQDGQKVESAFLFSSEVFKI
jgi:hypothetical protein